MFRRRQGVKPKVFRSTAQESDPNDDDDAPAFSSLSFQSSKSKSSSKRSGDRGPPPNPLFVKSPSRNHSVSPTGSDGEISELDDDSVIHFAREFRTQHRAKYPLRPPAQSNQTPRFTVIVEDETLPPEKPQHPESQQVENLSSQISKETDYSAIFDQQVARLQSELDASQTELRTLQTQMASDFDRKHQLSSSIEHLKTKLHRIQLTSDALKTLNAQLSSILACIKDKSTALSLAQEAYLDLHAQYKQTVYSGFLENYLLDQLKSKSSSLPSDPSTQLCDVIDTDTGHIEVFRDPESGRFHTPKSSPDLFYERWISSEAREAIDRWTEKWDQMTLGICQILTPSDHQILDTQNFIALIYSAYSQSHSLLDPSLMKTLIQALVQFRARFQILLMDCFIRASLYDPVTRTRIPLATSFAHQCDWVNQVGNFDQTMSQSSTEYEPVLPSIVDSTIGRWLIYWVDAYWCPLDHVASSNLNRMMSMTLGISTDPELRKKFQKAILSTFRKSAEALTATIRALHNTLEKCACAWEIANLCLNLRSLESVLDADDIASLCWEQCDEMIEFAELEQLTPQFVYPYLLISCIPASQSGVPDRFKQRVNQIISPNIQNSFLFEYINNNVWGR